MIATESQADAKAAAKLCRRSGRRLYTASVQTLRGNVKHFPIYTATMRLLVCGILGEQNWEHIVWNAMLKALEVLGAQHSECSEPNTQATDNEISPDVA